MKYNVVLANSSTSNVLVKKKKERKQIKINDKNHTEI